MTGCGKLRLFKIFYDMEESNYDEIVRQEVLRICDLLIKEINEDEALQIRLQKKLKQIA